MTGTLPDWYAFILLTLAAYRVTRLIVSDVLLEPVRNRSAGIVAALHAGVLLDCAWCLGFWIGLAWYLAWQEWPHGTLIVAVPFAIGAVIGQLSDHELKEA